MKSYNNILSNLLLHILQKEKIATKIAAKIARVNGPLGRFKATYSDFWSWSRPTDSLTHCAPHISSHARHSKNRLALDRVK
jgi:hypothetical protein